MNNENNNSIQQREIKKVKSKNTEKRNNNIVRPIYFLSFIGMLVFLTIAYASLAIMLGIKINGPKQIEILNWRIEWDNVKEYEGSVKPIQKATIDEETKTEITYEVELPNPGTYYSFDADMVNRGTIDAKVSDIIEKGLTDKQKKYVDYSVKYKDGTVPSKDDVLNAGERRTVTVTVKFKDKDKISFADLPQETETLNLSYKVVFVEK